MVSGGGEMSATNNRCRSRCSSQTSDEISYPMLIHWLHGWRLERWCIRDWMTIINMLNCVCMLCKCHNDQLVFVADWVVKTKAIWKSWRPNLERTERHRQHTGQSSQLFLTRQITVCISVLQLLGLSTTRFWWLENICTIPHIRVFCNTL